MTTEHQPGSPGVDLDGIELPGVLSFLRENFVNDGAEGESVHRLCALAERMAAELRTLRARVGALEELERWHAFKLEERSDELIKLRARAESAEARVKELEYENVRLLDENEQQHSTLCDETKRAEFAEARARPREGKPEFAEARARPRKGKPDFNDHVAPPNKPR